LKNISIAVGLTLMMIGLVNVAFWLKKRLFQETV
jgi:hypothetical protein